MRRPTKLQRNRPIGIRAASIPGAFVLFIFFVGCAGQPTLMPTPNLYTNALTNPFEKVPPALRTTAVGVLYGTDRGPEKRPDAGLAYGTERSKTLAVGGCIVDFGDVTWGELMQASLTRERKGEFPITMPYAFEQIRFPPPYMLATEAETLDVDDPWGGDLGGAVHATRKLTAEYLDRVPKKEVYLYIHGYNNTFEDAAVVIAQIWHFMGREGLPAFYSWPAGFGGARGYFRDRESGEFTIFHLKTYLRTLAGTPGLEKLHIIAHSRGTDVILTALRELHLENGSDPEKTRKALKLGNLILAAPDMDLEVAGQRVVAEMVHRIPERMTVYNSPDDKAIGLASWLFGSIRRMGRLTIGLVTGREEKALEREPTLEIIEADVETDVIGHSYFYSNPAVSSDVILILRDNLDPGAENGRPLIKRGRSLWSITDDYPLSPKSRKRAAETESND